MAVDAVVSVVIQKLKDMLKEESVIHDKGIVDQLEEIRKELEKMRGFLVDAEDKPLAKLWAGNYLRILYSVEDEIEKFALRIARQRKRLGFLMNHALFFNNLNACRKLRRKMKKIRSSIKILNNEKPVKSIVSLSSFHGEPSQHNNQRSIFDNHSSENGVHVVIEDEGEEEEAAAEEEDTAPDNHSEITESRFKANALQKPCSSAILEVNAVISSNINRPVLRAMSAASRFGERLKHPKLLFSYSYDEEELGIVGFKKDVNILVGWLTDEASRVVLIVGELGSGKTTLARAIYGRRDIKHCFDYRAWVFVSKEYTKRDLLLSLLKQVGDFKDPGGLMPDEEALETRVFERLNKKSYLVVFDNVWTCEVWEKLKKAFPDTDGSKIVFTTGDAGVAECADTRNLSVHYLKRLSRRHSWNMFLKKAGLEETSTNPVNPNNLNEKILKICNGLPLNIVLLGGLLSTTDVSSWSQVLSSQVNWHTSDILSLSYDVLNVHEKLCLLYLVLFPKEYDVPVRRLLRLWLAEGFVKRSKTRVPEDVVHEYFEDLVHRSMIQVSKLRSDGSPKRCRLLGVLHDYLLPKAQDISLFYIHRNLDDRQEAAAAAAGPPVVRRMVEYVAMKNLDLHPSQLRRLRSYLSFNFQKKDTPAKEVGRFVGSIVGNGFGLLRVLDLEGVYKPSLPDKLGNLFHLRYLGLRRTFLSTLPPSVGDLPYLETLDMKHTYINNLPSSIWKLKHLRHLNLNEIRLDMPTKPGRSSLSLLTLWGLFVDQKVHESPVNYGLNRLVDLRELGMTFHLSSGAQQDLADWIAKLTALQSLRLRSKDDGGRPSELVLKPFSSLVKLSHLNMLGNLQKLPDQHEFPPTLKVLTLSVSQLDLDPMQTLGQLPSLTVLRLLANSYLGTDMKCLQGGFGKLRVLKLWMLKRLNKWDVEDGAMQSLKELNIRCCDSLTKIPPKLLRLRTIEELILTNMPDEFTADVRLRKQRHTSLTVNKWDFTPLPWEQDDTASDRDRGCNGGGPLVAHSIAE